MDGDPVVVVRVLRAVGEAFRVACEPHDAVTCGCGDAYGLAEVDGDQEAGRDAVHEADGVLDVGALGEG